ncbi:hypothetical protein QR680_010009 [Steinernema hermaphroditum]|uniref:Uncharacterized protein n=1 Tax=Steinernema hermaphroditum TaxID=289476 RepID=A0AA39IPB2_9BILA|nr:hypothetical protein QR680_010009 [Steinernema hermaphroditum]
MACVVKRERCVERKTVVPKYEWPQREEKCRAKACWSYGAITGFVSPMVKKEDMERDCTDHRPGDATKAHKQEHKKVVVEWELRSSDDSSDACSRPQPVHMQMMHGDKFRRGKMVRELGKEQSST